MKIFIIGPLPPYKGGISHSNAVLCRNLSKHDLTCISFKRQFPEFLYPGKKQKDHASRPIETKTFFILDSINPISWVKIYKMIKKERPYLLAFQWWSPFFLPAYYTIAYLVKKSTGTKVSAICQNVLIHEKGILGKIGKRMTKIFFKKMDFLITYSSSDRKDAKKLVPDAKVEYVIEGLYSNQLGEKIPKSRARKRLGIEGNTILFFGFVREYKGLIYLLRSIPEITKSMPINLLIVGEFWDDKGLYLEEIEKLGIKKHVKIVDRYVSDKEAILFFSASDAVALPYITSTESGIIQLAFGLNTPVITTTTGGNPDLIDNRKTGLLVPPHNPQKLAEAIIQFYEKNLESTIKRNMEKKKMIFQWTKGKERIFLGDF